MDTHEDETIDRCHLVAPTEAVEGRVYRRCAFRGLTISVRRNETPVVDRPVVRDVRVERCRMQAARAMLLGVVLEDVVVDRFDGPVSAEHCAFRNVVLKGHFPREVIIRGDMGPIDPEYWTAFGPDNEQRHATVDVALDVSEATFANLMVRDVPPSKLRIDPYTQAVITLESIAAGDARFDADQLVGTVGLQVARALRGDLVDHLVVVPSGSRTATAELTLIRELHTRGLTLPAI